MIKTQVTSGTDKQQKLCGQAQANHLNEWRAQTPGLGLWGHYGETGETPPPGPEIPEADSHGHLGRPVEN